MKRSLKILLYVAAAAAFAVCVLCCLYIYQYFRGDSINADIGNIAAFSHADASKTDVPPAPVSEPDAETDQLSPVSPAEDDGLLTVESVVDFDELEALNPDIYAWVEIPSLSISLAVVQHPTDNDYYLRHAANGSYYSGGSIFTQDLNTKTFEDPMTILYGHNYKAMFGPLNRLSNPSTFKDCEVIRVYTRDRVYEYSVFAAFPFSNRHLLYLHDFNDPAGFEAYFAGIDDMPGGNFRKELFPSSGDRVLTLSTCVTGSRSRRFLVEGVLTREYKVIPGASADING